MSNYNFAAHAASDRRKWVVVTISILLIIAVIVTGVLTDWFTNWNKYCVFGHDYGEDGICTRCGKEKLDEVEKAPSDNNQTDEGGDDRKDAAVNGGGMASVLPGNGILLMAAKMAPIDGVPTSVIENTWTLTTTVNEEADDKYINWSVRWKDAQDVWAQDKTVTDYVTVTPTDAGALTATVKVLKDFGSQIEVVATSRDNPEKSAVCLFDYVQKITGLTFNMPDISSDSTSFTYEFETTEYTVESKLEMGFYVPTFTASADQEVTYSERYGSGYEFSTTLILSDSLIKNFREQVASQDIDGEVGFIVNNLRCIPKENRLCLSYTTSYTLDSYKSVLSFDGSIHKPTGNSIVSNVIVFRNNTKNFDRVAYAFRRAVELTDSAHGSFIICFKATYNDTIYSSGTKTIDVRFDGSSLHIPVTDVTLDQDHILA